MLTAAYIKHVEVVVDVILFSDEKKVILRKSYYFGLRFSLRKKVINFM